MIVVDSSAVIAALDRPGAAREALVEQRLHAPHLIDSEVAHALRRATMIGRTPAEAGWLALDRFRRLGITRHASPALLGRIWELRDNLTASDATSVALAESLRCALLTTDARISRAPGIRCPVTVLPG